MESSFRFRVISRWTRLLLDAKTISLSDTDSVQFPVRFADELLVSAETVPANLIDSDLRQLASFFRSEILLDVAYPQAADTDSLFALDLQVGAVARPGFGTAPKDTGMNRWGDSSSNAHKSPQQQFPGQDADFTAAPPATLTPLEGRKQCFRIEGSEQLLFVPTLPIAVTSSCSSEFSAEIDALEVAANSACGVRNWRLPNVLEFKELFNFGVSTEGAINDILIRSESLSNAEAGESSADFRAAECSPTGEPGAAYTLSNRGQIIISKQRRVPAVLIGLPQ